MCSDVYMLVRKVEARSIKKLATGDKGHRSESQVKVPELNDTVYCFASGQLVNDASRSSL